jgi:hypothetical protein
MMQPPVTRAVPTLVLSALAILFGGCASSYEVKVDSISQPQAKEVASYKIQSRNGSDEPSSLRYQEATNFIKTALSGKGLYEAPADEEADMIVEVDYGVEPPRVVLERTSMPIYAQVGGGVRYETVMVGTDSRGNPIYRTVAVYEPTRTELIGYQEMVTPVAMYEKYLRISARENGEVVEGRPPPEIWSVNVSSEDESDDLRKYLPILASASIDYIGKDTGAKQTIKVKETDSAVGFVKQGM